MLQIEPKERGESSAEYAYRVIRENLVTMRLQPGTMVGEQEIAEQLGMSRTPVREALSRLARIRIIDRIPQIGNRVSLIDYEVIEEVRTLRLTIEQSLMEDVCDKLTDTWMERIDANIALQRYYLERSNQGELMRLDNEFHHLFYEICGRELSYQVQEELNIHFDRVRYASLEINRDNKTVHDHAEIANCIRRKDAAGARRILDVHLNRVKADKESISIEYGKYFKE